MEKHLVTADDIKDKAEAEKLFGLADDIRANPEGYEHALKGKIVANLFFEPSTRTRLSSEAAVMRLGGRVLSVENGGNSSIAKGETLEDTIRTVMGYCDAIVMRHSDDDSAERAARVSRVPIINGGSGKAHHPTQSLTDVYTMRQLKGRADGLSVGLMGDLKYGRTVHSLAQFLSMYNGVNLYGVPIQGLEMPPDLIADLAKKGVQYKEFERLEDLPRDTDVLYYTRVQNERLKGEILHTENYGINTQKLKRFSAETFVFHPLPRNHEISADMDTDPRSVYFTQAHNGVPVRSAVMATLLDRA